jgi:hypothetical protein
MARAKHRKPRRRLRDGRRIAVRTAAVTSISGTVLIVVLSATSLARPGHQARIFEPIIRATEDLKPHPIPVTLANDFSGPQSIQVRRGDTLSSIAARVLGKASRWPILWWDNRGKVPNPNMLPVGVRLKFGSWHTVRPWLSRRAMAAIPRPKVTPAPSSPTGSVTVAATPMSAAATPVTYGGSGYQSCVISRESGGNPAAYNAGSGAGGLYQFLPSTWAGTPYGPAYPGGAQTAPIAVQNAAYAWLYAQSGSSPWSSDGC